MPRPASLFLLQIEGKGSFPSANFARVIARVREEKEEEEGKKKKNGNVPLQQEIQPGEEFHPNDT